VNQHPFTAALADQHRTDLMDAARHARDYRRAKSGHARTFRFWPHRAPNSTARQTTPLLTVAGTV
jgi:hypothetical protein